MGSLAAYSESQIVAILQEGESVLESAFGAVHSIHLLTSLVHRSTMPVK